MTIKGSKLALLLLLVVALEILLFEGSDANLRLWPWNSRRRPISSRLHPRPSPSRVNNRRQYFYLECPRGSSISLCESQYKEGRTYYFECKKGPCDFKDKHCSTSYEDNDYNKPFIFRCPHNGFIAGVGITDHDLKGYRRFSFRCCLKNGYEYDVDTCTGTDYLIRWHKPKRLEVLNGHYLVGISIEPSYQADILRFQTCPFKKAANMDESLRTANSNLRYKLAEERE